MTDTGYRWDQSVKRFKNTLVGVLILSIVAAVTFLSASTDLVDWLENRFFAKADLEISSLATGNRLIRLPGRPLLESGPDQPHIFAGGFRSRISLEHNKQTTNPIRVTGIRISVDEFLPGNLPQYRYRVNLDEIIGRGTGQVRVFQTYLSGKTQSGAEWIDEKGNPQAAKTDNLLDIDPPKVLTLQSEADTGEELDITVMAEEQGLYKIRFVFDYFVAGKDKQKSSETVLIYFKE